MNFQIAMVIGGRAATLAASPLCVCLCTFLFDRHENPISLKTLLGKKEIGILDLGKISYEELRFLSLFRLLAPMRD